MHAEVRDIIKLLGTNGIPMIIISDANSVFIQLILKAYFIDHFFDQGTIFTNPAVWDDQGRLRVSYYDKKVHGCAICPRNMCKGKILDEFLRHSFTTPPDIIYIGDGAGDYCPCLQLAKDSCILAKHGFTLLRQLEANSSNISATVVPWDSGVMIYNTILSFITDRKMLV